jgi:hypothetical protein
MAKKTRHTKPVRYMSCCPCAVRENAVSRCIVPASRPRAWPMSVSCTHTHTQRETVAPRHAVRSAGWRCVCTAPTDAPCPPAARSGCAPRCQCPASAASAGGSAGGAHPLRTVRRGRTALSAATLELSSSTRPSFCASMRVSLPPPARISRHTVCVPPPPAWGGTHTTQRRQAGTHCPPAVPGGPCVHAGVRMRVCVCVHAQQARHTHRAAAPPTAPPRAVILSCCCVERRWRRHCQATTLWWCASRRTWTWPASASGCAACPVRACPPSPTPTHPPIPPVRRGA